MDPNKPPTDDSTDLLDEETSSAERAPSLQALRQRILHLLCPLCGGKANVVSHAVRRKKPNVFWRVGTQCSQCKAESTKTFLAEFLPPE
jgi:hypothetical protein